ncbi:MAG: phage tail tape measure protein, partial [Chitinivibrionales bacterium]|nr:phage tail tape measure protein [Chitinivibrionales bacterium]
MIMSNVMTVALQFTAIDMLKGVVARVRNSITSLGDASKEVKRDFDDMSRHMTTGLKAIAASWYALNKIKPGIMAAGDLQEAMINVRMNLMESGKDAAALNRELADVRSTAIGVSKIAPFSATDVVGIENVFLKAGLKIQDVVGKRGAAYAATALATLSGELPDVIAEAMVMMSTPFNVKGSQFGDLADFIQRVDAASATTIPELMEGMKYLSGTAASMKLSWQDTLKLQGLVAQSGL